MKNAAFIVFGFLFVSVAFITSAAGSDSLIRVSLTQSMNGSKEEDQSYMGSNQVQKEEESIPEFKVSETDIARTKDNIQQKQTQLALYTVVTIAIIVAVIITLIGLWNDPVCCFFYTLCPCCLLSYPCLLYLSKKYSEPEKILQNNLQKYVPGIFYTDDGLLKRYKPTRKELHYLVNIMYKLERP